VLIYRVVNGEEPSSSKRLKSSRVYHVLPPTTPGRNARVMRARERAGYRTAIEAAAAHGLCPTTVYAYENRMRTPYRQHGRIGDDALQVAVCLKTPPLELWPALARHEAAPVPSEVRHALRALGPPNGVPLDPEAAMEAAELRAAVVAARRSMPPRLRFIMRLRLREWSLRQIGTLLDLSSERVRQLYEEAVVHLRGALRPVCDELPPPSDHARPLRPSPFHPLADVADLFPGKVVRLCQSLGICKLRELSGRSREELNRRGVGAKSFAQIDYALRTAGLAPTTRPEPPPKALPPPPVREKAPLGPTARFRGRLSPATYYALMRLHPRPHTLAELAHYRRSDLQRLQGIGSARLNELDSLLARAGLDFAPEVVRPACKHGPFDFDVMPDCPVCTPR